MLAANLLPIERFGVSACNTGPAGSANHAINRGDIVIFTGIRQDGEAIVASQPFDLHGGRGLEEPNLEKFIGLPKGWVLATQMCFDEPAPLPQPSGLKNRRNSGRQRPCGYDNSARIRLTGDRCGESGAGMKHAARSRLARRHETTCRILWNLTRFVM